MEAKMYDKGLEEKMQYLWFAKTLIITWIFDPVKKLFSGFLSLFKRWWKSAVKDFVRGLLPIVAGCVAAWIGNYIYWMPFHLKVVATIVCYCGGLWVELDRSDSHGSIPGNDHLLHRVIQSAVLAFWFGMMFTV